MTSPLECLPAEVFNIIAACLDLPEYQTLRLTSQRLHLLSLSTFKKKYFTKVITTLGSPSLDRLLHVANHLHLSSSVTTVEIRLLNHRDYKDLTKIARIGIFPPPKRFPRVSCVRTEDIVRESTLYDDVLANRQAKCITERLARALQGFDNLTTLRFRTHQIEPLGWKTMAVPEGDEVFRARCLRAVLDALLKSNTSLQTLTMGKEKPHTLSKPANIPYPAINLSIEYLQRLRPLFSTLHSLTLSIVSAHNAHHRLPGWENGLSRFISSAPHLTHLTLSLDRKTQVSEYSARIIRSLSDALLLPNLQTLHLCNTTLHESDLAKLLKTHAETLQRVNIANVCLLTGSWVVLLTALRVLEGLQMVRLAHVEGAGSPVVFRARDRKKRKMTLDASREGREVGEMLDELVKACLVDGAAGLYAPAPAPA